jgi:membrane-associated protease RseP (regulator of RpoE activity)
VRSVAPGSPAERAGIRPGHVIVAVNGQQVSNHQEVINFVSTQQPGSQVDLAVSHPVVLGARPSQPQAAVYQNNVPAAVSTAPPAVPVVPAPGAGAVQTGVYQQGAAEIRGDADAVVRPGDADRDGRVLDGDGRIGPRERAAISGRRR